MHAFNRHKVTCAIIIIVIPIFLLNPELRRKNNANQESYTIEEKKKYRLGKKQKKRKITLKETEGK